MNELHVSLGPNEPWHLSIDWCQVAVMFVRDDAVTLVLRSGKTIYARGCGPETVVGMMESHKRAGSSTPRCAP